MSEIDFYEVYFLTTTLADEAYAGTEATAAYGRVWTVATEQASRTAASASALAGAINAVASTTGTPWANYDNAVAAADSVFASLVAPAQRDQILAEADAETDFTVAQAAALRALRIAQAQSTATRDNNQANSEHDLAILAMTAENLAAPHFSMITWQAAQTAIQTGKFQGAPARTWDEPAAPATSPAGPAPILPRTPFLPNPNDKRTINGVRLHFHDDIRLVWMKRGREFSNKDSTSAENETGDGSLFGNLAGRAVSVIYAATGSKRGHSTFLGQNRGQASFSRRHSRTEKADRQESSFIVNEA